MTLYWRSGSASDSEKAFTVIIVMKEVSEGRKFKSCIEYYFTFTSITNQNERFESGHLASPVEHLHRPDNAAAFTITAP